MLSAIFRAPLRLSVLLLVFLPTAVFAQGTDLGSITGTVKDSGGALVPQAKVVATDVATNTTRGSATNDKGEYTVSGLNSGKYNVVISAPGFATLQLNGVTVEGSSTASADATLQISTTRAVVEVTAENPPVDSQDQTITNTLNSQAVTELPRDSRDVYSFLYLNPNITQGDVAGDFKFLGQQSYGASFSLDGQRSNGGIFGDHTQSEPSLEAVNEVLVQSNDFSAEYAGIANIRITTKRGTDQYHGSVIYNNKNSALAAWTLQDKNAAANFAPTPFESSYPNPRFNINDLGGSFGGRVPKIKNTWFFTSYERDWTVEPTTIYSNNMPHPSLYTGNFTLLNDAAKPDVPAGASLTPQEVAADTINYCSDPTDPTTCGLKFTQIPQRLLNPTVQKLINTYFPKIGVSAPINPANGRVPGFATLIPGFSNQDLGTVRLDHNFSDNDRVYVAYNIGNQISATSPVVSPFTGLGLTQNSRLNHTVSASYTKVITPAIVNELRGGFNEQNLFRHSNTTLGGFLSSIGFGQNAINNYAAVVGPQELNTYGQTQISFANTFQTFSNGGRNTDRPLNQNLQTFGDTLTWIHGTHNMRFGADIIRNQADDGFTANRGSPRGALAYTGTGTDPFTDFLLGLPPTSATFISSARPPMDVYDWESGYFFQDDWKVSPRLTLNLGLRYELDTPFIERNDLMVNLDPNYINAAAGQLGILVVPSEKTLQYLDPRLKGFGVETAAQAHVGRGLINTDKNDWAPRAGFAWRITDKNVLRGGWGLYYPTPAAQGMRDALATNAFNEAVTSRKTLEGWPTSSSDPSAPIAGGTTTGFGNSPSINAVPFNLRQPRVQQYNVTFERDLGWNTALRLSYLGTTIHGLIAGTDYDELPPNNIPFGTTQGDGVTICDPTQGNCALSSADLARLPFPTFAEFVLTYRNFGHGQSNAFQTQIEHRYTNGLMLTAFYTYQDQKSTGLDTGNSSLGGIAYNPFSPNSDYGEEAFVSHHRFVAYGIYDLPVGRDRKFGSSLPKWVDAVVGGWQTTFNMFAKSGTGFTPFWLCDDCDPVEPGNIAAGSIDAVGDFGAEPSFRPTLVSKNYNQKVGDAIWNAAAFGLPSSGADLLSNPANVKRNLLWGPSTWGVNLGVHKNFHFGERVNAQLGADVDNLFNHPLLLPDTNYGGGGAPFAYLGDFNVMVDQNTGKVLPLTAADITYTNPDFGRLINSFPQEGIDSRRSMRLRLRITF